MLLRWIVQQYAREAAEGGIRKVAGELQRSLGVPQGRNLDQPDDQDQEQEQRQERRGVEREATEVQRAPVRAHEAARDSEFLPCDAAIIFALGIESGGLVDLLQDVETSRHTHGVERAGKLQGKEVVLIDGGIGQLAAARATAETIKFYRPRRVISAGFAGGLTPELRRGHVMIGSDVVNASGELVDLELKVDPQSLAGAKGIHVGRLVTVDRILREPEERRELASSRSAIACDMETFAVARVCREQGVPMAAIRIISDAVDDQLPPEIEQLLAQKSLAGKLGAATGAILKRFSAAKDLWKLREDALKASDRLAKFLVRMLEQLP